MSRTSLEPLCHLSYDRMWICIFFFSSQFHLSEQWNPKHRNFKTAAARRQTQRDRNTSEERDQEDDETRKHTVFYQFRTLLRVQGKLSSHWKGRFVHKDDPWDRWSPSQEERSRKLEMMNQHGNDGAGVWGRGVENTPTAWKYLKTSTMV